MLVRLPLAATIMLGAFLVFQVQPMIARFILPWFGGSPAVWTASMLFFQVMLLAGYAYTHFTLDHFGTRRQAKLHIVLLAISLLLLPITPEESAKPAGDEAPLPQILLLLLTTVGVPYLLASSTAPLLQAWYAATRPKRSPYALYALSNVGSLAGLLLYPFVIEPTLGLRHQTQMWSWIYVLFAVLSGVTALALLRRSPTGIETAWTGAPASEPPPWRTRALWLLLSALGVIMLLAATNQLCRDVAVIPLLWVVPLALYLLSFVLTFGRPGWYIRSIWGPLLAASLVAVTILLHRDLAGSELHIYFQVAIYCAAIFCYCVVCHGELHRLRPSSDRLTGFYLALATGGALGGITVAVVAPLLFSGYWEFHLVLLAVPALLVLRALHSAYMGDRGLVAYLPGAVSVVALGGVAVALALHVDRRLESRIETVRSFFGVLQVEAQHIGRPDHLRLFRHGRIEHGKQYLQGRLRRQPVSYYGPSSGVGIGLAAVRRVRRQAGEDRSVNVGAVGLGVGAIAAYGRRNDRFEFYEIDAEVERIARDSFYYLADSRAEIDVTLGDARISLERQLEEQGPAGFDLIAVDAFNGDGIPVHLITREALALYRDHLAARGIIAFHISNKHFDLRGVVRALAQDAGLHAAWIEDPGNRRGENSNDWVLLHGDDELARILKAPAEPWPPSLDAASVWTDDYANVLGALWDE